MELWPLYFLCSIRCLLDMFVEVLPRLRLRCLTQVFAVHMGLISQLEVIGGLEEWALYVAQHLPDGPEWRGLRDQLVCHGVGSRAML